MIFKTVNGNNDGIDEDDGDEILLQLCNCGWILLLTILKTPKGLLIQESKFVNPGFQACWKGVNILWDKPPDTQERVQQWNYQNLNP